MQIEFKNNIELLTKLDNNSLFLGLNKMVAKFYVKYFRSIIPWSILLVGIIALTKFIFHAVLGMDYVNIFLMFYFLVLGMFYIQNSLYGNKHNDWILWLIVGLPYVLIPLVSMYFFKSVGTLFAIASMISLSFFIQEIVARKSTMFDAYSNSLSLTWGFNFKLLLLVTIPFYSLLALKIYVSGLLGISSESWLDLIYIVTSVLFLPWFAILYAIFYEYLRLEKPNV